MSTSVQNRGVSVITCTNRPHFFENVIKNYKRQLFEPKELIIVLNKDSMNLPHYRQKIRSLPNVSVFKVPEQFSLGRCLNAAVSKTNYPFIAKFDDDDYYSPYYLREQLKALRQSGAGIVGKSAHLKYYEGKRLLALTSPKQQNKFVLYVAGGTLLFKKRVHQSVRFRNLTLGEDVDFMRRCRSKGYKIYSSSPYNFVGIRRKNKKSHTWKESDENLIKQSRIIARTTRYRNFAIRPIK